MTRMGLLPLAYYPETTCKQCHHNFASATSGQNLWVGLGQCVFDSIQVRRRFHLALPTSIRAAGVASFLPTLYPLPLHRQISTICFWALPLPGPYFLAASPQSCKEDRAPNLRLA